MTHYEPEPLQTQRSADPMAAKQGFTLKQGPETPSPLQEKPGDVRQGNIVNCPLAAFMVAMAHARHGALGKILGAPIKTAIASEWKHGSPRSYSSAFYFDVTFPGQKAVRITPQIYHEGDRVQYAQTKSGPGWPSYIEKAYAVLKSKGSGVTGGTYTTLEGLTLNDVAADLVGRFGILEIKDAKQVAEITKLAKNASKAPTVAASVDDGNEKYGISGWHGYAILKFEKKKVLLMDPVSGASVAVPAADFHKAFKAIAYAE